MAMPRIGNAIFRKSDLCFDQGDKKQKDEYKNHPEGTGSEKEVGFSHYSIIFLVR
jgi:hypothetical protein